MSLRMLAVTLAFGAVSLPEPAQALSRHDWNILSRVGEIGLGLGALGGPAAAEDWPGFWQAGGSIAAGAIVTGGLKEIFPEARPDGSGDNSFPSGHTTIAFASAATLYDRYGWQVGLPATLAATFVGVARIEAKKHYWYDVVAGAAIGGASGLLITQSLNENVRLVPWSDGRGGGFVLAARF